MTAYDPLLEAAGIRDMIRRSGWVCVYETEAAFHGDRSKLDLQRRRGVRLEVLQPEELRQLEPGLAPIFKRAVFYPDVGHTRSEEHTSELQSLMRISYAVFCLKKTNKKRQYGNATKEHIQRQTHALNNNTPMTTQVQHA